MLTKRPQNIERYLPDDWGDGYPNVWLGTTVEDQVEARKRIPHLVSVPAFVRFLSCEPLLGPLDLFNVENPAPVGQQWFDLRKGDLHWIITGGESGANYRPANPDWFRSLRDQCQVAGVPFLFKQWEGKNQKQIKALGRELDGVVHDGYPTPTTQPAGKGGER